jgi:hypothetical protein
MGNWEILEHSNTAAVSAAADQNRLERVLELGPGNPEGVLPEKAALLIHGLETHRSELARTVDTCRIDVLIPWKR